MSKNPNTFNILIYAFKKLKSCKTVVFTFVFLIIAYLKKRKAIKKVA